MIAYYILNDAQWNIILVEPPATIDGIKKRFQEDSILENLRRNGEARQKRMYHNVVGILCFLRSLLSFRYASFKRRRTSHE